MLKYVIMLTSGLHKMCSLFVLKVRLTWHYVVVYIISINMDYSGTYANAEIGDK